MSAEVAKEYKVKYEFEANDEKLRNSAKAITESFRQAEKAQRDLAASEERARQARIEEAKRITQMTREAKTVGVNDSWGLYAAQEIRAAKMMQMSKMGRAERESAAFAEKYRSEGQYFDRMQGAGAKAEGAESGGGLNVISKGLLKIAAAAYVADKAFVQSAEAMRAMSHEGRNFNEVLNHGVQGLVRSLPIIGHALELAEELSGTAQARRNAVRNIEGGHRATERFGMLRDYEMATMGDRLQAVDANVRRKASHQYAGELNRMSDEADPEKSSLISRLGLNAGRAGFYEVDALKDQVRRAKIDLESVEARKASLAPKKNQIDAEIRLFNAERIGIGQTLASDSFKAMNVNKPHLEAELVGKQADLYARILKLQQEKAAIAKTEAELSVQAAEKRRALDEASTTLVKKRIDLLQQEIDSRRSQAVGFGSMSIEDKYASLAAMRQAKAMGFNSLGPDQQELLRNHPIFNEYATRETERKAVNDPLYIESSRLAGMRTLPEAEAAKIQAGGSDRMLKLMDANDTEAFYSQLQGALSKGVKDLQDGFLRIVEATFNSKDAQTKEQNARVWAGLK